MTAKTVLGPAGTQTKVHTAAPGSQEMTTQLIGAGQREPETPKAQGHSGGEVHPGVGFLLLQNSLHIQYQGRFLETSRCHCCSSGSFPKYRIKAPLQGHQVPPNDLFAAADLHLLADATHNGCCCPNLFCCGVERHYMLKDKYNGISFTLERPCACGFLCLPCWPLSCAVIAPYTVYVKAPDGSLIGRAEQATRMCTCYSWIKVFDARNALMYTVSKACCQSCCLSVCLPNCCCRANHLLIRKADAAKSDTAGEIAHAWPGCCRNLCTSQKNIFVSFPEDSTGAQRALLLGAAFLANTLYFPGP